MSSESNNFATELPDSFEDSVKIMVVAAAQAEKDDVTRMKIVFDTTGGDITYTTLKNTMPMMQQFVDLYTRYVILGETANEEQQNEKVEENEETKDVPTKTMRVYFPDAGSAALAERDWKLGTNETKVPDCVRLDCVTRDQTASTDQAFMILCPRASEAEDVEALVNKLTVQFPQRPIFLINPELVDMGVTGYGMAGRRIRERLTNTFNTIYYLKTLEWGALTRQYAKSYTIWQEDESAPGGYKLLDTLDSEPSMETMEEIYELANGITQRTDTPGFLNAIADFVNGMQKL
eukprot:CAMPEP_0117760652 /NCGR_PEP_ID=MMETSP0947-20121206/16764_1 /TAXON_ID=44440 /ORGANISM="Chattonella subsalsa, Strain CCMP2191" /LENGTH=290 /DNA_ID=CAMNT_0005581397 /DNA_START=287 /DNA_END=1159 /DNA_ORIENTATION=+